MEMTNSSNQVMPNNNMALAIVATVLGLCSPCCIGLVLGIVAIVFANQVKSKYAQGDFDAAEKSAKNAKMLAYIAIGLVVANLIYVGLNWDETMLKYQEVMEQYQLNGAGAN